MSIGVIEGTTGSSKTRRISGIDVTTTGEVVGLSFFVGFNRYRLVTHVISTKIVGKIQLGSSTCLDAD